MNPWKNHSRLHDWIERHWIVLASLPNPRRVWACDEALRITWESLTLEEGRQILAAFPGDWQEYGTSIFVDVEGVTLTIHPETPQIVHREPLWSLADLEVTVPA